MKKISTVYETKVQFYDLDPMNVLWHGNYVKYIESARCDMLDKIGYTYDDMRADGCVYPVAKMELKFIKPARFNQKLKIVSTLESVEPSLNIRYEVFDFETNEKLFKAKTMQIRVETSTNKTLYTLPVRFAKKIEEYRE